MYNMKKQTAVEWMVEQVELISNNKTLSKKDAVKLYDEVIQKANAMFEEQIIGAYTECWMMDGGNGNHKLKEANEYFNETYGGDK
jgi:hypothetical protein